MNESQSDTDSAREPLKLRVVERIWLDTRELCDYLGISESQSYQLRKQGLPYCKVGKLVRFDKREVDRFMKGHQVRERPAEEVVAVLRSKPIVSRDMTRKSKLQVS